MFVCLFVCLPFELQKTLESLEFKKTLREKNYWRKIKVKIKLINLAKLY